VKEIISETCLEDFKNKRRGFEGEGEGDGEYSIYCEEDENNVSSIIIVSCDAV
jgi:hypothetical protein